MSEQIETAEALDVRFWSKVEKGVAFQMAAEGGERVLLGTNLSIIRDLVPFLHAWPLTVLYRPDTPAPAPSGAERAFRDATGFSAEESSTYTLDGAEPFALWLAARSPQPDSDTIALTLHSDLIEQERRNAAVRAGVRDEEWRAILAERSPQPAPTVSAEQVAEARACAWSDYRKEYGATAEQHAAFTAGWDAAMGRLDIGGVQR